jgi:hypothetical protein
MKTDVAQSAQQRDGDDYAAHPRGAFLHFLVKKRSAGMRTINCRSQIGHRQTPNWIFVEFEADGGRELRTSSGINHLYECCINAV